MDGGDDHDDVDVAGEHGDEEEDDHDNGPDGPRDEGLLLLFIIALGRCCIGLFVMVSYAVVLRSI